MFRCSDHKTVDKIIEDINEQLKDYEGEIVIIPKLEGLNAEEIITALDKAFGEKTGGFVNQFTTDLQNGMTSIDLYGLYNSLIDLGISTEIATEIANGAA